MGFFVVLIELSSSSFIGVREITTTKPEQMMINKIKAITIFRFMVSPSNQLFILEYASSSTLTHRYVRGIAIHHLTTSFTPTSMYKGRAYMKNKPYKFYFLELIFKAPWIIIGAIMTAISLEAILIPNGLIDGGITGISMILSKTYGLSLSMVLFILNIPFVLIGYKHLGKRFAFLATLGIVSLTISTAIIERSSTFVEGNFILLIIIGGLLLGMGIGIVLRNGGALDGTDILALLISNKTRFSVGEAILVINILIFLGALILFGWKGALISIITYYIATRIIDIVRT